MYTFLRRPAWLALHVVVLGITIAFVLLGRWQLERLEQRRDRNTVISERLAALPVQWLGGSSGLPPEYTRLLVSGVFAPDEEVLLRSQVNLGRPGFDLLTPLYIDDASAVIVNRGWVPLEFDSPPVSEARPPAGEVTVGGFVRYPLVGSSLSNTDDADGDLKILSRVDLDRLDQQVKGDLEMFYVELTEILPATGSLPILSGEPEVSEGSHFSYAIQWFAFALVSTVGYAALIRTTARRRAGLNRRVASVPLPPS